MYHFISYVPIAGSLYELDGLKEGPINLGACTEADWLSKAAPAIQERIERYAASEIRFNVMAVIRSKADVAAAELAAAQAAREALLLRRGTGEFSEAELARIDRDVGAASARLAAAAEQQAAWRDENIRRKHNYVPFIYNFLKVLADTGKLKPLIEAAKAKQAGRV